MDQLPKCRANHPPLSPIGFLRRAAAAYADRTSVVYGTKTRFTWRQTSDRCCRMAAALRTMFKINKNDVVSVLAPNIPAMYEMHFAVPMAGGVLNAINTRLDVAAVATILNHSEAKALFVDCQYVRLAADAIRTLKSKKTTRSSLPVLVVIDDIDEPTGQRMGEFEYESIIAKTDYNESLIRWEPDDEWDPLALNYTSGTTSAPKGVVSSHRGGFLTALNVLIHWRLGGYPVYLWSLPMFHSNGWTLTWAMAACGGTNVCARGVDAKEIIKAIKEHGITHMCGAPVVFSMILDAAAEMGSRTITSGHDLNVLVGGAPPPAALLHRVEQLGCRVSHAYGLTETTGPALFCEWQPEFDALDASTRSSIMARQGIQVLPVTNMDVVNSSTRRTVPRDGKAMGEILFRGSGMMKGYYKNPSGTAEVFRDNGKWFATGDVGVVHPNGYVEVQDRVKDVIISGGENVSSIEVESVLSRHPEVTEVAVVAMPHPWWGETPCAFVVRRGGGSNDDAMEKEIVAHCRKGMAGFMVPKKVVFVKELPRTGTGKVIKVKLRERAKALAAEFTATNGERRNKAKSSVSKL